MKSLVCVVALLAAAPVQAQALIAREKIAVASFKMIGAELADPARQAQMRVSLQGGLALGFDLVPEAAVARALESEPSLSSCDTTACLKRLAELVSVRRLVRGQVEVVGSSNWTLSLELVDTADASVAGRVEDTCDVCNVAEAKEKLSNAAAQLRARVAPPGELARPFLAAQAPERPHTWRSLGLAGASLGAASLIVGIACLALHNSQEGLRTDGSGRVIVQRWNTLGEGVAFTLAGALLVGSGAWAIWHDRALHRMTVTPRVDAHSAGLLLDGRF